MRLKNSIEDISLIFPSYLQIFINVMHRLQYFGELFSFDCSRINNNLLKSIWKSERFHLRLNNCCWARCRAGISIETKNKCIYIVEFYIRIITITEMDGVNILIPFIKRRSGALVSLSFVCRFCKFLSI